MSSFNCPQCGEAIIDQSGGGYITGCPHYPLKKNWKDLSPTETKKAVMEGFKSANAEQRELVEDYEFGPFELPPDPNKKLTAIYAIKDGVTTKFVPEVNSDNKPQSQQLIEFDNGLEETLRKIEEIQNEFSMSFEEMGAFHVIKNLLKPLLEQQYAHTVKLCAEKIEVLQKRLAEDYAPHERLPYMTVQSELDGLRINLLT